MGKVTQFPGYKEKYYSGISNISFLAANDKEYIFFRYGYSDSLFLEFSDFLPVDLFIGDYYVRNGGVENSGIELTTIHYSDRLL